MATLNVKVSRPCLKIGFVVLVGSLLVSPLISAQTSSPSCRDIEECLRFLQSDNVSQKTSAIFTLGRLKDRRAVPVLMKMLKKDSEETIRFSIIRTLGVIGDPSTVPVLSGFLKERKFQDEAVKALIQIGGEPAVEAFIKALRHRRTQRAGIQGLAEIGGRRAKSPLTKLYQSTDNERIQGMASIAIQRIRSRWGPTEKEMGLPIYPTAKYMPNVRAEWIFTTGDSFNKVADFYKQRLNVQPMKFRMFKEKHESGFKESKEGRLADEPDIVFVVEKQVFLGTNYPSKLLFIKGRSRETEIKVYRAVGGEN